MKFSVVANGALVTSTIYAIPFEWQIPFSYFGLEAPQSPPPSTPVKMLGFFSEISAYFNEPLGTLTCQTKKLWLQIVLPLETFKSFKEDTTNKRTKEQKFYLHLKDQNLPNHQLRVKDPSQLGIDSVKQYSGYFDRHQ